MLGKLLITLPLLLGAATADPIDTQLARIEAQRAIVEDQGTTSAERLDAAQEILDTRARLIREQADDPRRPIWLADQASDLFFVLLPIEASGLTCRFGLPSDRQRARARRVAIEMDQTALEALAAIERALRSDERPQARRHDPASPTSRHLLEGERDRRIPFLRGAGAYLRAELAETEPAARREGYRRAADLLVPLARSLPPPSRATAQVYAGLAVLGADDLAAAEALLREAAAAPVIDAGDAIAARLGLVSIATRRDGAAAGLNALEALEGDLGEGDLLLRLLIADQRFLLRREIARRSAEVHRDPLLAEAFESYLDLLDGGLAADPDQLRQLVLTRLAEAADAQAPLDRLPALVAIGRARRLARDAETRPEAVKLCRELLSDELDAQDRADTLWTLGVALLEEGQLRDAAHTLALLARDHPTDAQAETSVELAATVAAHHADMNLDDPAARGVLRQTLDLLLERYPNISSIDRWRYARAALALDDGDYEDAMARFARIPPNAPQWGDAQAHRVRAAQRWAETQQTAAGRRRAYRKLLDLTGSMQRDLAGPGVASAELVLLKARSFLELGEPERALEALVDFEAGGTLGAEARLVQIEASWALDRSTDAARHIRQLAESGDPSAAPRLVRLLQAQRAEVDELADSDQPVEAANLARGRLAPLAEALEPWSADRIEGRPRTALLLSMADAYLLAERYDDAKRLYDLLLGEHPNAVEALLGKAECLYGLGGHSPEAMSLYRRIAASAEPGTAAYWQSQLRMLQILSDANRNTHRIAPHIERLRKQDPELGGERYRRGLERLLRKHR